LNLPGYFGQYEEKRRKDGKREATEAIRRGGPGWAEGDADDRAKQLPHTAL